MIKINGLELAESSIFPGGEVHVKLPELSDNYFVITTTIRNSNDLIELLLISNALRHKCSQNNTHYNVTLFCMYLPYARQDRVCRDGEAFSLEVIASLFKSMKFRRIYLLDVHSEVYKKLDWGCTVSNISISDIVFRNMGGIPNLHNKILVAPDAGAAKKVEELAQKLNLNYIVAKKKRDLDTRKISVIVSHLDGLLIQGKELLIVDDICDGGGTFVALSNELMRLSPALVSLYVTHGIFSKGLDVLKDAYISHVYTTDSFCELEPSDYITIFKG